MLGADGIMLYAIGFMTGLLFTLAALLCWHDNGSDDDDWPEV